MQKFSDDERSQITHNPAAVRRVRAGEPVQSDWPEVDDLPIQYADKQRLWTWTDVALFGLVAVMALAGFTRFVGWW
jgi:hypothetical protein